jgi:peptidoglycan/LPS O-acetylase OafA/YrhL
VEGDTHRLRYLDGLRALAVLAVVVFHAVDHALWAAPSFIGPMRADPTWWFANLVGKGGHGVDLFFVLSGFCLSYPVLSRLRRSGETTFDVGGFFAKRIVRIVPPFYAALILMVVAIAIAHRIGIALPSSLEAQGGPFDFVRALLFLDYNTHLTNGSFWSLFVEFRWYLFFPIVLALYVRSPRAFFTLGIACVVAYNFTTFRAIDIAVLPAFMLGIVAADWHLVDHRLAKHALILTAVCFDIALVLEPYAAIPSRFGGADEAGFWRQTNVGWQLAAFFLVVAVGRHAALRRVFEFAPLRAIGVAAYGIYLVHHPIVNLWTDVIAPNAGGVESFCGAVALGLAGGFAFWFVAERPFVADPLRGELVRRLRDPLARAFVFCGLPLRLALEASPARVPAAPVVAERQALVPMAVTTSS